MVCVRVTGVKQCKDATKIEGVSVRRTGRTLWARDLDGWRLAVCGVWCAWPAMEGGGASAAKARGKEETPPPWEGA